MAIKINNKDLYRRVINWQDVQRVILNWSQIRPTSQPHIDYHIISNWGTGGWWWGGTWVPWWWSIWWWGWGSGAVIWENWVSNWWDTAGGSQWTAELKYNWMPSLLNAYKGEIIYSFYWNQTETSYAFDSYLIYNSSRTYGSTIRKSSQNRELWFEPFAPWEIMQDLSAWNYVMTAVLDLENESATLTLEWPNWFSEEIEASLTSTQIFNIRHSTDFWVELNDGVRLSRVDFYVYNNSQSQPVPAGVYHNATLWVISLSSDWTNWITIADKNLWATMVWNRWDAYTASNCWGFFQWGNNYMFPFSWAETTSSTQVDASTYWPWNYYSNSTFIIWHDDWSSVENNNLRWEVTNTDVARKWPCDYWFHVPSPTQVSSLFSTMDALCGSGNWDLEALKIPPVWIMNRDDGTVIWTWAVKFYWTSASAGWNYAISFPDLVNSLAKAYWFSIRPFANTPVVPDNTRTVLYQPQ